MYLWSSVSLCSRRRHNTRIKGSLLSAFALSEEQSKSPPNSPVKTSSDVPSLGCKRQVHSGILSQNGANGSSRNNTVGIVKFDPATNFDYAKLSNDDVRNLHTITAMRTLDKFSHTDKVNLVKWTGNRRRIYHRNWCYKSTCTISSPTFKTASKNTDRCSQAEYSQNSQPSKIFNAVFSSPVSVIENETCKFSYSKSDGENETCKFRQIKTNYSSESDGSFVSLFACPVNFSTLYPPVLPKVTSTSHSPLMVTNSTKPHSTRLSLKLHQLSKPCDAENVINLVSEIKYSEGTWI